MPKRTNGKMELVEQQVRQDTVGSDYERFWHVYNNRELIMFTKGKTGYQELLISCFPQMPRERALEYTEALISLVQ